VRCCRAPPPLRDVCRQVLTGLRVHFFSAPCAPLPANPLTVTLAANANATQQPGAPGCSKLRQCGDPVAQGTSFVVTLTDNLYGDARSALGIPPIGTVSFLWHDPAVNANLTAVSATALGNGTWALALGVGSLGVQLLEAFTDGVAWTENPLLVAVVPPVCPSVFARADSAGVCQCLPGYKFGADGVTCLLPPTAHRAAVSLPGAVAGSVCGAAVLAVLLASFVVHVRRRADSQWRIPMKEIKLSDPPDILGRGTFGLVIKGTYRGTVVAVKRTLPPDHVAGSGERGGSMAQMSGSIASNVKPFDLPFQEPVRSSTSLHNRSSTVRAPPAASVLLGRLAGSGSTTQHVAVPMPAGAAPAAAAVSSGPRFLSLAERRKQAALRADFAAEMRLVVHLRHPCITTVLGAVLERGSEPLLVMEHMERGSLYDLLHNDTVALDADMVLPIVMDVVSGLAFLHAAQPPILHNDLKAANVLVDANFRAKVSDFGLSGKSRATGGQPGTPLWMAPELLRQESRTTPATDVYAFGILLAEVFTRDDPYARQPGDLGAILSAVAHPVAGQPLMRPALGASVPPPLLKLMRWCWAEDPGERPSMVDVVAELQLYGGAEASKDGVTSALAAAKASVQHDRALLHQVFPPAVAAALTAGRRVEPQLHDCVTVFFADVCSFTELAARMQPLSVANMLDRLYTVFDRLCQKHGLFKNETIGDAYLVTGNLIQDQGGDHCARVAAFALDVVAAAQQVLVDPGDPKAGYLHVRAGLHCGPIVATVVGTTNPRFCLFGDTVNKASRMESNSAPDRVTLSDEAAALLRAQCPAVKIAARGLVNVKGKGEQCLHWLLEMPPSAQPWLAAEQPPAARQGSRVRTEPVP
jgi:serine/threonine protein kinase